MRLGAAARMCVRGLLAATLGLALALAAQAARNTPLPSAHDAAGEAIYRTGVLGNGAALQARRDAGASVQGRAAACINCHRRSGLGAREGRDLIPPITGRYLYRPRAGAAGADTDMPYVEGMRGDREPYTDATLARAIREGVDSEGHALGYLMPRFRLGDADMAALIAYLKQLDRRQVPGVTASVLHFATVVTPDADPAKRRAMLNVLKQFFADKNANPVRPTARLHSSRDMRFLAARRWELHVWELSGAPSTWEAQLAQRIAAEPVFAVLSGLGGADWEPVRAFCEHQAVPCLFPNVDVPQAGNDDFYSLYFSRGLLLEAELIAARLAGDGAARPMKVMQVYREGDSGEAAARALAAALQRRGMLVGERVLAPHETVVNAFADNPAGTPLVLWLRPVDLAALPALPALPETVYVSGLMGGLEAAPLPAAWRTQARMAYPVDLPERRRVRVDYAFGWLSLHRIPIEAPQVQADTYLACGLVAEALAHVSDTFVREYLVERLQDMVEHRVITGYYPRLTLGNGQRFASKGGYLVRFAGARGTRVVADGPWTVPSAGPPTP